MNEGPRRPHLMTDSLPSSSDSSALARQISRLWTLTVLSLTVNFLIIVLIVIGVISHHHQQTHDRFAQRMAMMRMMHGGFGGMGMNRGFGPMGGFRGGPGGPGGGFGGNMNGGPGGGSKPGGEGLPPNEAILQMLTQKLSLNDDEKAKVKAIIDSHVAEVQKQMEAQHAAVKAQAEDAKAKIKPLLTPDQQKELDALPLPGE